MIVLVCGGSGCGKSAYAEKRIMTLAAPKGETIYYLATMEVYGEEGKKKVMRHLALREGKGMLTLEQTRNIAECIPKMLEEKRAVLLEDLGNLVANEMFSAPQDESGARNGRTWNEVADHVLSQIRALREAVSHLVIVTNNVFEDGIVYEGGTMQYMRALGKVNEELTAEAEEVVELVVGIPLSVKGEARA